MMQIYKSITSQRLDWILVTLEAISRVTSIQRFDIIILNFDDNQTSDYFFASEASESFIRLH